MRKSLFALAIFASTLFACAEPGVSSRPEISSSHAPFVYAELKDGEARIALHEGEAILWWEAPEYDGYRIYSSESKYGTYSLVSGSTPLQVENYSTRANRYGYFKVMGVKDNKETQIGATLCLFGDSTLIVGEHDNMSLVQDEIDQTHARLESGNDGQFSSERYGVMFLKGNYPDISMRLGYYTSACGLGETPDDTKLGEIYVSTNVLGNNNSTCTFWRNIENVSTSSDTQFAVSQAPSIRRCHFEGSLALSHPSGWSSGGFLADSKVDKTVYPRTQQQWLSRNDDMGVWSGSGHNYAFIGCEGTLPLSSWSEETSRTTIVEKTPVIAEMPFLYKERDDFYVFLPDVKKNTSGLSWDSNEIGDGRSISLDRYYLAREGIDDDKTLNAVLDKGQGIIFTPGIYHLDKPLHVKNENTLLLGLGYATLEVSNSNTEGAILIDDVGGVRVGSLLLDAGKKSDYLLKVGNSKTNVSHKDNPCIFSDIFGRLGGKEDAHTEVENMVIINQNDVIGDNFWLWRADHSRGIAWNDYGEGEDITYGNPGDTGLLVNGDNVTCYALMVEHFEKYQTLWKGENGATYMYQSETPYNVPNQEAWKSHNNTLDGYASYKVEDNVKNHKAFALGVYWVHWSPDSLERAIEVPENDGISLTHLVTTTFSGYDNGGIRHVVNDYGEAVGSGGSFRALVENYPLKGESA